MSIPLWLFTLIVGVLLGLAGGGLWRAFCAWCDARPAPKWWPWRHAGYLPGFRDGRDVQRGIIERRLRWLRRDIGLVLSLIIERERDADPAMIQRLELWQERIDSATEPQK